MSGYNYVGIEVHGRVCVVTLKRPEKKNALNFVVIRELKEVFQQTENDASLRVIVLKADGDVFSAGMDLEYVRKLQDYGLNENLFDVNHLMELYLLIYKHKKVVIAQVEGAAYASGLGLLTACDMVYAAPNASFACREPKFGFIPALYMAFLIKKLGDAHGREMLLTGDTITAERAYEIGLVNKVIAQESIDEAVMALAHRLAKENAQGATELTKRLLADIQDMPLFEALSFSARMNAHARSADESRFGTESFLNNERFEW